MPLKNVDRDFRAHTQPPMLSAVGVCVGDLRSGRTWAYSRSGASVKLIPKLGGKQIAQLIFLTGLRRCHFRGATLRREV